MFVHCPPCGALVPDIDGPRHAYLPAIPGCWELFGRVQAQEMQRYAYPPAHRLVVDAYCAQHPGPGTDRRDRQSVVFHLASLYVVLELGLAAESVTWHSRRLTETFADFPVLQPPDSPAAVNVESMLDSKDLDDYTARAQLWAESVWGSWRQEHQRIRDLIHASR